MSVGWQILMPPFDYDLGDAGKGASEGFVPEDAEMLIEGTETGRTIAENNLKVIDEAIPEPVGGAHTNHEATAAALQESLIRNLEDLRRLKPDKLVRRRREKFLKMGAWAE